MPGGGDENLQTKEKVEDKDVGLEATNIINSADKSVVNTAVDAKYPPKAETNKEASVGMINDYLDANFKDLTTGEADMIYVDLFKSIVENGSTTKSIDNINAILLNTTLDNDTKNMVMSGIIQNIKERTEKNENFVNKILDKKTNPDEWQKRADDLLEKLELEGMTVGKKEMSYTVGTDGKILLGKGWFPPHDERNGDINTGYGGYDPNVFKDGWTNKSLSDKPGYTNDRYFLVNEKEETKTIYNNLKIKDAILKNKDIPSNAQITVNINKDLVSEFDIYDKNNETTAIENIIYANTNNKIAAKNITVNLVDAAQADNNVKIDVSMPAKEEILSAPENVLLTTTFDVTKSNIDEGGRRDQLINTFGKYLKQDESGKYVLNTEDYRVFKINSIEGNASSIFDPNTPVEEAKAKNEQYAKDRLNTALAFLNEIGTPQDKIAAAPQTSQVHYERKDQADQNIKIDRQVQSVKQKAEDAYIKTIPVEKMPTEKTVTWDVVHTRLSNAPKDDPDEGLITKIFG